MIALLQRVSSASVKVNHSETGRAAKGLLVLLGVEKHDDQQGADKLLHKLLNYRVFEDSDGKMNLSISDIEGDLLLVPQFTLAANTQKGLRPSFSSAAAPQDGKRLFDYFVEQAIASHQKVNTGVFGADMQVHLINDGPVTFWLQV